MGTKRSATGGKEKAREDFQELYHQYGIPVLALGRQRLALLGAVPSGAGAKAHMSRASVGLLSLKCHLFSVLLVCPSILPGTWTAPRFLLPATSCSCAPSCFLLAISVFFFV